MCTYTHIYIKICIHTYLQIHTCFFLVSVQSNQVSEVMAKFCGLAGVPGMRLVRIPGLAVGWASRAV